MQQVFGCMTAARGAGAPTWQAKTQIFYNFRSQGWIVVAVVYCSHSDSRKKPLTNDKRVDKLSSLKLVETAQKSMELSWMCQSKPHEKNLMGDPSKNCFHCVFLFKKALHFTTCSSTTFSTDSQNQHPVVIKSYLSFPQAIENIDWAAGGSSAIDSL